MISVVYFGTHNFSASVLQSLLDSGLFEIKMVVTQPDRPVGRKKEMQSSPVKILAQKYNIKIEEPITLKNFPIEEKPQINIVCQYGLLIPKRILESATYGSINTHTSLLPKYRGASPIQSALIAGEKQTGVTIMLMDELLDHGPILSQATIDIDKDETYLQLSERMSTVAAKALIQTVQDHIDSKVLPQPQNHDGATFCSEMTRDDGQIDWTKTADQIYNLYRGLTPWPGIWTQWNDKRLKLLEIKPVDMIVEQGKIIAKNGRLLAGCGNNTAIEILNAQIEGKGPMKAKDFINGFAKLISTNL